MQVPRAALAEKLSSCNSSQQSIEGTAKWLLFYSQDAATIVPLWSEELARAPADKKLALLYLANHVLQDGRKKDKNWVEQFAKVIVKAFRDFAARADDKAKKSAERLVKVWEERRVFSAVHAKQLRDAIKTAPAPAAAAAAGPPPPSAMASSDLKKLQASGKVPDVLLDVAKAEQAVSFILNRAKQIKTSISTDGSFAEVASAKDVYANCVKALQGEVAARRRALAELRALITRQEAGLSQSEDSVRSYELLHRGVEDRFRALQQQRQAEEAAAAATKTAQAPPPPPLSNYATALPPHLAQGGGLLPPHLAQGGGLLPPHLLQPAGVPNGFVPLVPQWPPNNLGGAPPAGQQQQQQQHAMYMGIGPASSSAAASAPPSSSGGTAEDFQMTDDMAAQLLSNTDTLMSLAKSLAEFTQDGGLGSSNGIGSHQHGGGGLAQLHSGGFGSEVGVHSFGGDAAAAADMLALVSPEAPGMDEYDPDDPV